MSCEECHGNYPDCPVCCESDQEEEPCWTCHDEGKVYFEDDEDSNIKRWDYCPDCKRGR